MNCGCWNIVAATRSILWLLEPDKCTTIHAGTLWLLDKYFVAAGEVVIIFMAIGI